MVTQVAQGQVELMEVKVATDQLAFLKKPANGLYPSLTFLKARQNMKDHPEVKEIKPKAAQAVVLFGSLPLEQSLCKTVKSVLPDRMAHRVKTVNSALEAVPVEVFK
jgi:hypothetical protein